MGLKDELMGISPELARDIVEVTMDKFESVMRNDIAEQDTELETLYRRYAGLFEMTGYLVSDIYDSLPEERANQMAAGVMTAIITLIELAEVADMPSLD